jgi:hypothetical protein
MHANAKQHIVSHLIGKRSAGMLVFRRLMSQSRTPTVACGGMVRCLLRNGCSVVLGCDDAEGDFELVFYFYGAASDLYRSNAVIGLQDGDFSLTP